MHARAKPQLDPAMAPLAEFHGERPPAPAWFDAALADAPERGFVEVEGARIETLAWGERGRPGLLFLHGNGAHADWWSALAPLFAADWRVAAFSFSGMGGSDWREAYTLDLCLAEAMAAARATGLFEGPAGPVFVAHSFGAVIASAAAALEGDRLSAAVLVDPPFRSPEKTRAWRERRAANPPRPRPTKLYPSLAAGLARFRFLPPQATEHPYLVDHIARGSLKPVEGGFIWRFDPQLWAKMTLSDVTPHLADPKCPIAFMHGDRSRLAEADDLAHMWETAPAGSPVVMIPDADHHLMIDQPLAFVAGLRGLLAGWPRNS